MDLLCQGVGVCKARAVGGGLSLPTRQPRPCWGSARGLSASAQEEQAASPHPSPTHHASSPKLFHPAEAPRMWEPQRGAKTSATKPGGGWTPPSHITPVLTGGPAPRSSPEPLPCGAQDDVLPQEAAFLPRGGAQPTQGSPWECL